MANTGWVVRTDVNDHKEPTSSEPLPLPSIARPTARARRPLLGSAEAPRHLRIQVHPVHTRAHTHTSTCRWHVYFAHTWGPAPHAACPHSSTCGLQVDLPLTPSLTHQPALCLQSGNHQSVARAAAPDRRASRLIRLRANYSQAGRGRVTETWSSPGAWGRVGGRRS